jgi:hypothetical protein
LSFTSDAAAVLLSHASSAGFSSSHPAVCLKLYLEAFLARQHRRLPGPPAAPLPAELRALLLELNRVGNNLNQAVHIAHASRSGLPSQTPGILSDLLGILRSLQRQITTHRGTRP